MHEWMSSETDKWRGGRTDIPIDMIKMYPIPLLGRSLPQIYIHVIANNDGRVTMTSVTATALAASFYVMNSSWYIIEKETIGQMELVCYVWMVRSLPSE